MGMEQEFEFTGKMTLKDRGTSNLGRDGPHSAAPEVQEQEFRGHLLGVLITE
jgi:hypothetical protein